MAAVQRSQFRQLANQGRSHDETGAWNRCHNAIGRFAVCIGLDQRFDFSVERFSIGHGVCNGSGCALNDVLAFEVAQLRRPRGNLGDDLSTISQDFF
ncbi:MAG: hypothetical protein HOP09_11830 [Hyphomicrobium sp.]|nr:hypothetical protein [Hyphomicrobium sp.]